MSRLEVYVQGSATPILLDRVTSAAGALLPEAGPLPLETLAYWVASDSNEGGVLFGERDRNQRDGTRTPLPPRRIAIPYRAITALTTTDD